MQTMHTSMHLVCKKCQYEWEYAGNKHRTSCSKCKTSITIVKEEEVNNITYGEPVDIKFPYKLWKDARFTQRMQNLPSMGEDYITLKIDMNGVLSLE